MMYNYIMIDETLSQKDQLIQKKKQISIMMESLHIDKMLASKLASISCADLHTRIYDFNPLDIYSGHYHILKYMLNNGYLTKNVLDFSETVAKITETGGGCMYAILGVHTHFLREARNLYVNFDALSPEQPPFIEKYPYLDELYKYNNAKMSILDPELKPEEPLSLHNLIYRRIMQRDVPNIVYFILVVALIRSI